MNQLVTSSKVETQKWWRKIKQCSFDMGRVQCLSTKYAFGVQFELLDLEWIFWHNMVSVCVWMPVFPDYQCPDYQGSIVDWFQTLVWRISCLRRHVSQIRVINKVKKTEIQLCSKYAPYNINVPTKPTVPVSCKMYDIRYDRLHMMTINCHHLGLEWIEKNKVKTRYKLRSIICDCYIYWINGMWSKPCPPHPPTHKKEKKNPLAVWNR